MEDKTIVCVDCSQPFVFTIGEQQFYSERGLTEVPKRCKPCRNARRRRLRRRRRGDRTPTPRQTAPAEVQPSAVPGDGDGDVRPDVTPANGNAAPAGESRPAASGPRSFWDERPQWVSEAMLRALPTAPAGSNGGNGAEPESLDRPSSVEAPVDTTPSAEAPRRHRRRSRRRGRRRPVDAAGMTTKVPPPGGTDDQAP